ncbi:Crp/Fnr family transcriptional regulator [Hymenobacter terrenus]|uniref:Crp/Fnr family transcriptional regulator n=1 Tax=Hymenobacter terrenus TaxID=1629124 RepID=UPI000697CF03|nr:Crp/Fnr family transcriptional regulator [Hymenobacter terrenus]
MSESVEQYFRTTAAVPAAEWDFLATRLRIQTLAKQELWLPAGQVDRQLAFVETGVLRSFLTTDEREITNDFFLAGSVAAAFTSFLTQAPSAWTVQALAPCQLATISYELLQTLYARHSCWLHWGRQLLEAQFLHKCRRETAFLRASAAERYHTLCQQYPTLEQQVAQYHIASYLGIKPETLSRLRAATAAVPLIS